VGLKNLHTIPEISIFSSENLMNAANCRQIAVIDTALKRRFGVGFNGNIYPKSLKIWVGDK